MVDLQQRYDVDFYSNQLSGSRRSAEVIVPIVLGVLPEVTSVLDVGCGAGTWLRAFQENGVARVCGIDGGDSRGHAHESVRPWIQTRDLEKSLGLLESFDLVVSLEVAEHLAHERSAGLIAELTAVTDVVLFSAAIPGQGGHFHINEQWAGYWVQLFARRGFAPSDLVRRMTWNDPEVEWWYRQNAILFTRIGTAAAKAVSEHNFVAPAPLNVAHPLAFEQHCVREAQLEKRYTEVQSELAATRQELEVVRGQLQAVTGDLQFVFNELSHRHVGEVVAELSRLHDIEETLRLVYLSKSWRWTRPLRRD
jgi:SAM-dependent methyltransferase